MSHKALGGGGGGWGVPTFAYTILQPLTMQESKTLETIQKRAMAVTYSGA